jgi:beta-lactamase class A
MFVGSAIKTFILARFLKDVEEGRLTEDAQVPIDDRVRSLSSQTFLKLTGSVPARIVLEAMIAHSDNTATDAAMALVGHQRVRAFIAAAGLGATAIPRSTRMLFSYLAGAPAGKDLGWAGVQQAMRGRLVGKPRAPINDVETMVSTAEDFVSYYQRALAGKFFDRPETLREFKRIQAMGGAIARVVPPDILAYAKGGSIEWQDFYAPCLPGQMILRSGEAVTFCFTLNWTGKAADWPAVAGECQASVAGVLAAAAKA